jgi:peptidoglycan/LPS O-acetylase OafA/YrhL
LLLHGVLDYPSISAGAWYVAIDFQLYALAVALVWLAGRVGGKSRRPWLLPLCVGAGITLSLLHFNLDPEWDNWALYFFGSYGLGMMAWWAGDAQRKPGMIGWLALLALAPAVTALAINFRSRIALALAVACALFLFGRITTVAGGRVWNAVNGLARTSYAVFLVHFPVCLLVNAAFTRFVPAEPVPQLCGMLAAWGASLIAGAAFYRWVEVPLGRVGALGSVAGLRLRA